MSKDLAKFVDRGDIDGAVIAARGMTPERVRSLLFSGDGFMKDSKPYAEFISRWYQSLSSPYLRAEASDWFAQSYLTEIADVENAEVIGAKMSTESKKQVIQYLAESIDGKDISDWATSPEAPLSKAHLNDWKKAARKLRDISVP